MTIDQLTRELRTVAPDMSSRDDRRARKFANQARRKREDAKHMASLKSAYWQDGWHAWVNRRQHCPYDGYEREEWWKGYNAACRALCNIN